MDSRHSHYLLTQELLKNNIAVFRYDERGVGKSDGKFSTVTYGISKITNDLERGFVNIIGTTLKKLSYYQIRLSWTYWASCSRGREWQQLDAITRDGV